MCHFITINSNQIEVATSVKDESSDTTETTEPTDVAECVKWRQTGGCKPNGPREPQYDKECWVVISEDGSGFCECKDGRKVFQKTCEDKIQLTCNEACTKGMHIFVFL